MIRISTQQFAILSAAILMGTTFMIVGSYAIGDAGRDGWMAVIPGYLVGLPFSLMILSLLGKYPDLNFIEISEKILGKWLAKIIGGIFSLITIYFGACISVQGVDIVNRALLPTMPNYILVIFPLALILYLYYSGFEVMARFAEVIYPLIVFSLILICILIFPHFEQNEIFPILEEGFMPILKAVFSMTPWPMEYVLFLLIMLPFLPNSKKDIKTMRKGLFIAFLVVGLLNTIVVLVQILTFGPKEAARVTYGLLYLANMVEISRTINGLESIFLIVWLGMSIIKVTGFFYAGLAGLRTVFGLKSRKWALAVGLFYLVFPLYLLRGTDAFVETALIDQYAILPLGVFWVVVVWGVEKWKSRQKKAI